MDLLHRAEHPLLDEQARQGEDAVADLRDGATTDGSDRSTSVRR